MRISNLATYTVAVHAAGHLPRTVLLTVSNADNCGHPNTARISVALQTAP